MAQNTPLFNPTEYGQTIELVYAPYGDKGWFETPRSDRNGNEFLSCKVRVKGSSTEMTWLVYQPELEKVRDLNPGRGDKLRVQLEQDDTVFIEVESRAERTPDGGQPRRNHGGARGGGFRRGGGGANRGAGETLTREDMVTGIHTYVALYNILEALGIRPEHAAQAAATHFIRWDKGGRPEAPTMNDFEDGRDRGREQPF